MPELTVLMPVFNGAKYLNIAIESVLNQTYSDFEFLIVDDGSTDESEQIIQSYIDPRIHFIKNKMNLGLIETLNNSLELINTEFTARFDCDDICEALRFEKQISFLKTSSSVDIVGCQLNYVNQRNEIIGKTSFSLNHDAIKVSALFGSPMPHPGVTFRTKSFKQNKIKYDFNYEFAEDYELWQRALELIKFANLDEPLVRYRVLTDKISNNTSLQILNSNKIKETYLKKLRLVYTTDVLNLFINFVDKRYNKQLRQNFTELIRFLELLLHKNQSLKYFDQALLTQEFTQRIDEIIRIHASRKFKCYDIYKTSVLIKFTTLSHKSVLKAKLKQYIT